MKLMTREDSKLLSLLRNAQTPDQHDDTRRESALYIFGIRMNRYEEQLYTVRSEYTLVGSICEDRAPDSPDIHCSPTFVRVDNSLRYSDALHTS